MPDDDRPVRRSPADWLNTERFVDLPITEWRDRLWTGAQDAELSVARSMSEVISGSNLASLAVESAAWLRPFGEIREPAMRYMVEFGTGGLANLIQPAALAATREFAARARESSALMKQYQESLFALGWWVPPSASMQFFWKVGELAHAGRKTELRRAMVAAGRERAMFRMVDDWMEDEPFRSRRRFLLDGLRDHRRGRFRVSIPTLLPVFEGIAVDAFAPGSSTTNPRPVLAAAAAAMDIAVGDSIVETVTILWASRKFSAVPSSSRQLNRHLVLHGRSTGYGTEENSVKLLFAFDQLAHLIRRQRTGY